MTHTRATFLGSGALGALACALPARALAQSPSVRLGGLNVDLFAEGLYGVGAKTFARAGFDPQFIALTNGGAVISALAGNSLDLGMADLVSGVSAINAGLPIDLIAGGALYLGTDGNAFIAVLNDSPIHQPRDLIGKTISVPTLVGQTSIAVHAWLGGSGLAADSVRIVELPQSATFVSLQRGAVDAALLAEPFLAPIRGQVRSVGDPYAFISKTYMFSAWYATKAWVEADSARAQRMVGAIYETARWANTHRAETLSMLLDASKLDPERVQGMGRCTFATSLTPALVQPVFDIAAKYKIVDREINAASLITHL